MQNSAAFRRLPSSQYLVSRRRQLADQPIRFHRVRKPRLSPPARNARPDRPQVNFLSLIVKKRQFSAWLFQTADQIANLCPSWFRIPVCPAHVRCPLNAGVPLALIQILDHLGVQSARSGFTQRANQIQILNLCAKSSKSHTIGTLSFARIVDSRPLFQHL